MYVARGEVVVETVVDRDFDRFEDVDRNSSEDGIRFEEPEINAAKER